MIILILIRVMSICEMNDIPSISGKSFLWNDSFDARFRVVLHTDAHVMVEQAFFKAPWQMQLHRLTGPAGPDSTREPRVERLSSALLSSNRALMIKKTALALDMIKRDGCCNGGLVEETEWGWVSRQLFMYADVADVWFSHHEIQIENSYFFYGMLQCLLNDLSVHTSFFFKKTCLSSKTLMHPPVCNNISSLKPCIPVVK